MFSEERMKNSTCHETIGVLHFPARNLLPPFVKVRWPRVVNYVWFCELLRPEKAHRRNRRHGNGDSQSTAGF